MKNFLKEPISIAPLISFRILFGLLIFLSTLRFWYMGWIEKHYIQPVFHFKYFGFDWVEPLPALGMYAVHIILLLASLGVMFGFLYRLSAFLLFLTFTYCELIDLTYYLNHYYFVSLMAFWLIFVPAHRFYSIDCVLFKNKSEKQSKGSFLQTLFSVSPSLSISRAWVLIFQLQLAITYFYAGLAKLNSEWLFDAMPLKIWLPPHYDMPVLGFLMPYEITAYAFSWTGMIYDLFVPFALFYKKTRIWAYFAVVGFHSVTGYLFQIGVFPVVMIALTLIFFEANYHEKVLNFISSFIKSKSKKYFSFYSTTRTPLLNPLKNFQFISKKWLSILGIYFVFQVLFPFRFLFYTNQPYNETLFWKEEGFRFSWRVMLMEKFGSATFYVKNPITGKEGVVDNSEFLNLHQEKQMSFQPDMILQYARFLEDKYKTKENPNPIVRAEVYVTLNGRRSQLFFDPNLDLTKIADSFLEKDWINSLK
ncbi:Vitamin K-dependent gamma-carboxylase [Bernardetia litoralis DSM 6794]|uniref:Vitamin K-dependent gamma-carboxylase n=1 Tax=Bernardetia litoralis (strain ATCC 23117 / DSM 6794 / NBRC 15988 / NCIMB 1366 / Fx l1 / Sio-4) TaxID=880071 RepID=I4AQD4_BERLS|nr:HTTM domain-containing protein [Bernardetia litoralis]AFM06169.1 Vitamin K-dependent gamma-carboxylase [Bernardetia litoralis DSM 6794]